MKRKRTHHPDEHNAKQQRCASDVVAYATPHQANHPVLQRLYPNLQTLRHYLLSNLLGASKNRYRKISQLGQLPRNADVDLGRLLDTCLVGSQQVGTDSEENLVRERNQAIVTFTQQRSQASGATLSSGYLEQQDIVDYTIWRLFFGHSSSRKRSHLLRHGFQHMGSNSSKRFVNSGIDPGANIPGLVVRHSDGNVRTLKGPLWCQLLAKLGQGGDRTMMDLLWNRSIFLPLDKNIGNYYQVSGTPISELKFEDVCKANTVNNEICPQVTCLSLRTTGAEKPLNSIVFVRSRILFAKAAVNAKGGISFGMRHIHVLNRYSNQDSEDEVIHIMRYIFPRQFGLHNVFTSTADVSKTAMSCMDYTMREKEVHESMCKSLGDKISNVEEILKWKLRVPRRLRSATALIKKLRKLHQRCSYTELLRHYCPVESLSLSTEPGRRKTHSSSGGGTSNCAENGVRHALRDVDPQSHSQACFTDLACPTAQVSAFCRAIASKVIPLSFWGSVSNQRVIMFWIDQFILLRKFESLTLHQVVQNFQVKDLDWLHLPGQDSDRHFAKFDWEKRREIIHELVYWFFDSFLVPLIRSNFHVTESNVHRNRLFYFRHDVWRMLTEPALNKLRLNMFEELSSERVTRLLSSRQLGYSRIRLLPKRHGFRTIMNLRRRPQILRNGKALLGQSINAIVTPVFNAITYEKSQQPDKFGSSLFSVSELTPKLAAFKASLGGPCPGDSHLYFAKVDVQSCFDTIPQARLLSMIESLMSAGVYQSGKHVEVVPMGDVQSLDGGYAEPVPLKRYVAHGGAAADMNSFGWFAQNELVGTKSNTVFVNTNLQRCETKENLMQLLREHVQRNLVQIGRRYYRQKRGIPQGSILSSIMCNFFYAELERDVLDFTLRGDCLLLRLLDDFLLITTKQHIAERFATVMHRGWQEYGVTVERAKSLVNFEVRTEDGIHVPRINADAAFPYCGICIDTRTLEVTKKHEGSTKDDVWNSLTVELTKLPGQTFHRKALNAFKIQLKSMFIDPWLNSVATVLANVYHSFREAAVRCLEYARVLSRRKRMSSSVVIKTIDSMIGLGFVMLERRVRLCKSQGLVSRAQVQWLASQAFYAVFQRQQTQHAALVEWLRASLASVHVSSAAERDMLRTAAGINTTEYSNQYGNPSFGIRAGAPWQKKLVQAASWLQQGASEHQTIAGLQPDADYDCDVQGL